MYIVKSQQNNVYSVQEWDGKEASNLNLSINLFLSKMSMLQIIETVNVYYFQKSDKYKFERMIFYQISKVGKY